MLQQLAGPGAAPSSSASYLNDIGGSSRWGSEKTAATVAFEWDSSGVVQHRQVTAVGDDDLSRIKAVHITVPGSVALTGGSLPSGCGDRGVPVDLILQSTRRKNKENEVKSINDSRSDKDR
uniref:Uncharacterized protein n=1 Tax=Oryza sativa subsp. japonica TaxID=39947 RepID=Q6Z9U0_ORYSJ|nr:hypothetical protein [Oryza sativa Japonica Group]